MKRSDNKEICPSQPIIVLHNSSNPKFLFSFVIFPAPHGHMEIKMLIRHSENFFMQILSKTISVNLVAVSSPNGFTIAFLKFMSQPIHLGNRLKARLRKSSGVNACPVTITLEKNLYNLQENNSLLSCLPVYLSSYHILNLLLVCFSFTTSPMTWPTKVAT